MEYCKVMCRFSFNSCLLKYINNLVAKRCKMFKIKCIMVSKCLSSINLFDNGFPSRFYSATAIL
jgi:hypothetical protein